MTLQWMDWSAAGRFVRHKRSISLVAPKCKVWEQWLHLNQSDDYEEAKPPAFWGRIRCVKGVIPCRITQKKHIVLMVEVVIGQFLSNHVEHILSASKEQVFHLIDRNAKNKQNERKTISDAINY